MTIYVYQNISDYCAGGDWHEFELVALVVEYGTKAEIVRLCDGDVQLVLIFRVAGIFFLEANFLLEWIINHNYYIPFEELKGFYGVVELLTDVAPGVPIRAHHKGSVTDAAREDKVLCLYDVSMGDSDGNPVICIF